MEFDRPTGEWQQAATPLEKAIALVGSIQALANAAGVARQSVYWWLQRGVPIRHAQAVSAATSGRVTVAALLAESVEKQAVAG